MSKTDLSDADLIKAINEYLRRQRGISDAEHASLLSQLKTGQVDVEVGKLSQYLVPPDFAAKQILELVYRVTVRKPSTDENYQTECTMDQAEELVKAGAHRRGGT